jgi:hypothetical protein
MPSQSIHTSIIMKMYWEVRLGLTPSLKKPPALLFAVLHQQIWDYGIVFALWPETPPYHQAEGIAFIAASTLATGLLDEDSAVLCMLAWIF